MQLFFFQESVTEQKNVFPTVQWSKFSENFYHNELSAFYTVLNTVMLI